MPRSTPLDAAAVLVGVEGLALLVGSGDYLARIVVGRPHDVVTAVFGGALGVVAAAALLWLVRPLRAGRRFARSPVVLLELLAVPVAAGLLQGGKAGIAAAVGAPALAVLGLLATPSARGPFEIPTAG
ncbi:MAG TPA: hypothetical protein VNG13_14275 [Mycobacteriales bacterium]|nr:hypothetical protein [Mycobacteriales bacterium]